MAFKKIPLTIDTMIRNPVPIEGINQEDNIELNIVVTENKTPKDLSRQTIKVYIRRIDGTLVEQTDQITPTNASKGEVTVKLKNSAFNKEGYALFQLDVSDSIGRITSSYATFKIGKGLVSGEAIANTNEIEALKKVEEYIKKANQELETFKQTVVEINENEATRQENEVVRVREEASRNEAEAIRAQQEATRKEKENERVQAEIKRIADEEMRRENEVLRGSKELERKQAEELRKETEFLRIEDENNRKVAESKRIEAESVRVEAEKLRVAAETGRVEAENLRIAAEEERVAAETKREEGFNKFEGKINANTEELKNARSATTGEEFNSLDERIDCEVDRLNKKIEVSFLQQEDKENHVIENTVEGMTTNMIIKGKTLYKKSDGSYTDVLEENVTLESFGQQEKKISILSRNKNLFATEFEMGTLIDGNIGYESAIFRTKDFIRVNGGTNYIFSNSNSSNSIVKVYYDENKKWINDDITRKNSFTTPSNCGYVKFRTFLADSQLDWINASYMLEEGTQATSYQTYKEDKKDILLSAPLRENDVLYEDNGQVKVYRDVKQYTFTGDESFRILQPKHTNTLSVIVENIIDSKCTISNSMYRMCNNFFVVDTNARDIEGYNVNLNSVRFNILKSKLNTPDIDGFKAWLKANPTTVIYQLATPTVEIVENCVDIDLKTFNERTYVDFENSIKGTSSFKAPVNTLKTIARLSNENTRLKRDLALHAENTIATDEAITDYSLDMDYKLCLLEMELVEIKKKLGGK